MEKIILTVENEGWFAEVFSKLYIGVGPVTFPVSVKRSLYDLFFTDRRIIAAVIFSKSELSRNPLVAPYQIMREIWKRVPEMKEKKVWTHKEFVKKFWECRRAQFKGKTPEEILHLYSENLEIPYDCIRSAKVKKRLQDALLLLKVQYGEGVKNFDFLIPKNKSAEIKQIISQYCSWLTL